MTEILFSLLVFFLKTFIIVLAIVVIIATLSSQKKQDSKSQVSIKKLNDKFTKLKAKLNKEILDKHAMKSYNKIEKEKKRQQKKTAKKTSTKKRSYVLRFNGDIAGAQVKSLREEISAIIQVASKNDEVIFILESPGGMVTSYGLAASQLERLRDNNIPVTAIVDKVAASGGYMMACVANKIIAAPFAIIGSIGVVLQLPNFNKLLKKHNVDYLQMTAGEYKRTLSIFGEVTSGGKKHVQSQIDELHELFKQHIARFRPQIDLKKVATGDYWPAVLAKKLDLIDEISTSDDYIMRMCSQGDVFEIKYKSKQKLADKLQSAFTKLTTISF